MLFVLHISIFRVLEQICERTAPSFGWTVLEGMLWTWRSYRFPMTGVEWVVMSYVYPDCVCLQLGGLWLSACEWVIMSRGGDCDLVYRGGGDFNCLHVSELCCLVDGLRLSVGGLSVTVLLCWWTETAWGSVMIACDSLKVTHNCHCSKSEKR